MSDYSEYFFSSKASIVELECIEISHSAFSQVYRLVKNAVNGVTVTHEDATVRVYQYLPMSLSLTGPRDDLDQILHVGFGDLGTIIPDELDAVRSADAFQEKPIVRYRTYRSDDLSAPMLGPLVLEIKKFSLKPEGATFEAKAPSLNVAKTGEKYTMSRFPTQRGML